MRKEEVSIEAFDLNKNQSYAEAVAKLEELKLKRNQMLKSWNEAEHNYFLQQTGQDKQDFRKAARAILEGREESLSSLDDLRATCIRLCREYKAYCYAVELQEREIRSRRMEASQELHPLIRTRYEGLIRKVIFTYAEFQKASQAEEEFRKMLDLKDVAFLGAINIMCINLPGHFQNSTDWENYMAEAVESGYLNQSEANQLTAKGKAA
jgi:hypothetical protein